MLHSSTNVYDQITWSNSKNTPNKVTQNNNDTPDSVEQKDIVKIKDQVKHNYNNQSIHKMNYHIYKFPILLQNTYDALIDLKNS